MPKIKVTDLASRKAKDLQKQIDTENGIRAVNAVSNNQPVTEVAEDDPRIEEMRAISATGILIDNLENSTASAAQTANIAIRRLNRIDIPDVAALIARINKLEELSNLRISDLKYVDIDGIRYNIGLANPHRGTNNKNVKAELTFNEDGTASCYYPAPLNFTKEHSWRIDQENREFYFDGVVWPYMAWKANVRI